MSERMSLKAAPARCNRTEAFHGRPGWQMHFRNAGRKIAKRGTRVCELFPDTDLASRKSRFSASIHKPGLYVPYAECSSLKLAQKGAARLTPPHEEQSGDVSAQRPDTDGSLLRLIKDRGRAPAA